MKYVYIDEAGTSAKEPVRLVVAVVVSSDLLQKVEAEIERMLDKHVPPELRDGYIFHATKVFSGSKSSQDWRLSDRLCFIEDFLCIPRRMALPICWCACRQLPDTYKEVQAKQPTNLRPEQVEHILAFYGCLATTDRFLRDTTPEAESASAICEDVPGMKKLLLRVKGWLNEDGGRWFTPDQLTPNSTSRGLREGIEFKVTRIQGNVQFVPKTGSPCLQLADVCAFAMRRHYAGHTRGDLLTRAMLGRPMTAQALNEKLSFGIYRPSGRGDFD